MLPSFRNIFCAVAYTIFIALPAGAAYAGDPDFLVFSAGVHDVNDNKTTAEGRLEYRSDIDWGVFKPFTGFMFTADKATYIYAGVFIDLFFGRRWVMQPSFAAGAYCQGEGKNLGNTLEFRSQLEIAYRLVDRSRIGLSVNHISNASLSKNNPGTESIVMTYSVPLSMISGKNLWEK